MRGFLPAGFALLATLIPLDAAFASHVNVLHVFEGSDGAAPQAAVILDSDGNLYGTTRFDGRRIEHAGQGTVFEIDAK